MIYAHTGQSLKTATLTDDPVTKPKHYTFGYFEVIDVLQDWFPKNPLQWPEPERSDVAKLWTNIVPSITKPPRSPIFL